MAKALDMIGFKSGRLTVIERDTRGRGQVCRCDCGSTTVVQTTYLRKGMVVSCGCYARQVASVIHTKHGQSRTNTYRIWAGMMTRCYNPNHRSYAHYGGRGISVSKRWQTFANFYADMGERPTGMTIDRIDNDKGYSKGNCRWATSTEQNQNRRKPMPSPRH